LANINICTLDIVSWYDIEISTLHGIAW